MRDRELIADRFVVAADGRTLDLATGLPVWLRIEPAGEGRLAHQWADRCARLAMVWHPALAACVDFGVIGAGHRFEAYAVHEPERWSARPFAEARRVRAEVAAFLRAAGVAGSTLVLPIARRLFQVLPGPQGTMEESPSSPRPGSRRATWGLQLAQAMVVRALEEVLQEGTAAGTTALAVEVPHGGGGRTLLWQAARIARLAGWAPRASRLIAGGHGAQAAAATSLVDRHVAVLHDGRSGDSGRLLAACALALDGATRPRVLIHLVVPGTVAGALPWTPFSARALAASVVAPALTLAEGARITVAASRSGGRPGTFVRQLWGGAESPRTPAWAAADRVREARLAYAPAPAPARSASREADTIAGEADALVARGRRAAAERLLRRSAGMLVRRGADRDAADALVSCAELAWHRGRVEEAHTLLAAAHRAAERCGDVAAGVRAACWIGRAHLERLDVRASEHALRGAVTAARLAGIVAGERWARLGLARTLCWAGDLDRAELAFRGTDGAWPVEESSLGQGAPHLVLADRAMAVRLALARGDLDAARLAVAGEGETVDQDPIAALMLAAIRVRWLAHLGDPPALAAALVEALQRARAARRPLDAMRLRVLAAEGLVRARAVAHAPWLGRALRRACRQRLPPLLAQRVAVALAAVEGRDAAPTLSRLSRLGIVVSAVTLPSSLRSGAPRPASRSAMFDDVIEILRTCHDADEPVSALADVARILRRRLAATCVQVIASGDAAVVVTEPRGSHARLAILARALDSGLPLAPQPVELGTEAAAPVRHGGRVVGAVGCRWTAASEGDRSPAPHLLAAAAAAIAPCLVAAAEVQRTPAGPMLEADLIGQSDAMARVRQAIARAADAPFPVLVQGESGSGKELVARALHRASARRARPFCAVNCAALPDDLLEAELFGHVRGSFTGAVVDRRGLFEEADGGVLFLDEVGELSGRGQAKLLRVLQESEVRRIGDALPRRVDVRVLAATNRALEREVEADRFRRDLFYRLDVLRIAVPPLRERAEDVPALALVLWRRAAERVGTRASLADATLAALARYDWPGNVRELQNVLAALAVGAPRRGIVGPAGLPACIARAAVESASVTLEQARRRFEQRYVRAALARSGGNRGRAAAELGLTRQGLAKLLGRLGVDGDAVFPTERQATAPGTVHDG